MKTVWKYPLPGPGDEVTHYMPRESRVVYFGQDASKALCFWAEVDPALSREARVFRVHGTGREIGVTEAHRGTVIVGQFVWHLYESEVSHE